MWRLTSSYPGWIKSPHVVTCHTYFPIGKICHNFIYLGGGILHLKNHRGGGYSALEKSQSAKICLNFNFFWGGGYSATEKSQSAKMYLNFNFRGGYSALEKSQSAKICLNFNFRGGGILQLKNHKVPRSA